MNVILHLKLVLVIYVASFPGTILLLTIEDGSWVGSEEDYFSHLVSTSADEAWYWHMSCAVSGL